MIEGVRGGKSSNETYENKMKGETASFGKERLISYQLSKHRLKLVLLPFK